MRDLKMGEGNLICFDNLTKEIGDIIFLDILWRIDVWMRAIVSLTDCEFLRCSDR